MGIAGGLAQLIGYDTLVNSSVGMTNTADHQAVNISDYRRDNIENKHFIFPAIPATHTIISTGNAFRNS